MPGARLYATTNPDSPRHWLKTQYLDRVGELNLRAWHFRLSDNPSLSAEYVADLAAEYVGLWRRRMIDGAWCVAEGAIYDMWDQARHVVTDLPDMRRYHVGIDYGTTNPFAAVLLGEGVDGRLYVAAEWRHDSRATHRSMTDAQYSAAVREWLAEWSHPSAGPDDQGVTPEWTFIDPSAKSFLTQLWQDGYPGIARASNEVASGIRSVSSLLAAGRLLVHESCEGCSTNCLATAGIRRPPRVVRTPLEGRRPLVRRVAVRHPLDRSRVAPPSHRTTEGGCRRVMTVHMPVSLTVGDHTGNLGTLSLTPRDNIGVCIADMLRAALRHSTSPETGAATMTLPENGAAWPPPQLAPLYREMRVDDAWYSGDRKRLADIYQHQQRREDGRRRLWAATASSSPGSAIPACISARRRHRHTSADLLFSEPPTFTVDDAGTQDRLADLVEAGGIENTLLEAAEVAAASAACTCASPGMPPWRPAAADCRARRPGRARIPLGATDRRHLLARTRFDRGDRVAPPRTA
ncbi:hypothetical protein [Streptomyces albofaciens]|uniref:hypothetical protein n=1 Tax=Streptomyces albofaciens TaxID=66866 RepID=UPI001FCAD9AE|nr:hypothetical protein [Streptomyces albofaciens]